MTTHRHHVTYASAVMVFFLLIFTMAASPAICPAASSQEGTPSGAGMHAASGALTVLYFPVKAAFALCGGVVGGLTYAFTAGDTSAAQSVWKTSMYGTYLITPDHLKGNRPVQFLGESAAAGSAQGGQPVQFPAEPSNAEDTAFTEETLK